MEMYYIEVDTFYENSESWFVGPFESREAAKAWHQNDDWTPQDNVWLSTAHQCGDNIFTAWRIYPQLLTESEAREHGLWRYEDGDEVANIISADTRPSASALKTAGSQGTKSHIAPFSP